MVLVKSLFYNHVVYKKIWLRHEAESFTKKFIKLLLMMRDITALLECRVFYRKFLLKTNLGRLQVPVIGLCYRYLSVMVIIILVL